MDKAKKKVLITATVLSHIAQFHRPLAELLHKNGYEVHVAGKDNLAQKNGLKLDWADKVFDVDFSRSPKSRHNIKAYRHLKKTIDRECYSHIHCNTPMGGIVTRLASREARKNGTVVIYTAHGFHFHKRAPKFAWMVYYPIEKWFARYTDKLITINHEDYELAKFRFKCNVFYTHGVGVSEKRYFPIENEAEYNSLCNELGIPADKKVILAVGELLPNKNQKMAIKAMRQVKEIEPEALLIIAGNGPMKTSLEKFISDFDLHDNVRLIGYCTNLEKYQKIAYMLVACSYREGLPLNIVEAMMAENPVVATHNRGHDELIVHNCTGFLVEPDDSESMAQYIIRLLREDNFRNDMGKQARKFALDYSDSNVELELKEVYGL